MSTTNGSLTTRVTAVETVYEGWASMRVVTFQLKDGRTVRRHVEEHGQSACVLPYDPSRRCALLVRMARAPVLLSREAGLLEAPAGRCEDGDGRKTVRQEALEEAGVRLSELELVLDAWTMPAISAERSQMFIASYRLDDRVGPGGGVAEEGEEIEVVEESLENLWARFLTGGLRDLKTAFLLNALRNRQPDLFHKSV